GSGPGNPDLLTFQARQKLHSADVIVYDRLVSQGVLDLARREAEYIYVGKIPNGKSTPQSEINDILVEKAKQGLSVVRLKSGDPLIFGRADEEIEALEAASISFEICPGITSAAAAAASIGASLTARGHNKSVSFLTGHDAKGFAEHDWTSLAQPHARAAVYMGVGAARFIQGRLLLHGATRNLPIAIVENASRPNEKIVSSKLDALPDDLTRAGIKGPAILLIGYSLKQALSLPTHKIGAVS
ncbi:MAG: uroporphyrinogen-III C-methyltransferase, partial [Acidimicrobiales bacterium]